MKKIIFIAVLVMITITGYSQTFSLPEHLSPYDVAKWVQSSGFIASGTTDPTSIAEDGQLYTNFATPTAPILWMSYHGTWSKITSSFAPGTVSHADLVDLDYAHSGHTGFAASTDIPNNASFTLTDLGEKDFANLTGKPTNASYTLLGLSEHSFNSLIDKPTSANYTLLGLSEHSFNSLTDKPTSADYTLAGLGEHDFSSLTGQPTNASYTLLGLSEHSFNSLTDKPTSANYTLAGLGEHNFASLAAKPTTLSGYGITDGALQADLLAHENNSVNPHGMNMTLGTGAGVGGIGYLASNTIFISQYAYIPFEAAATTVGINSDGMTFWADDINKTLHIYNGSEWQQVIVKDSNNVSIVDVLKLTPGSAPATPTEGMIYQNSSNHHCYLYNGSAWVQMDN